MFDYRIYQIFEGRMLFPHFLFTWGRRSEKKYIQSLTKLICELRIQNKVNSPKYLETWYKLRMFPINEHGEYTADYPTRLGNIIQGYEKYSKSRYGIDAIFWWYRIWFMLDKDIRKEIDHISSKADFALFSSLVFYGLFIVNLIASGISHFDNRFFFLVLPSWETFLLIALVSLISGRVFYKLSLSLHRNYGEFFKSIFDVHKKSILEFDKIFSREEKVRIEAIARYLQYHKLKCVKCDELNPGDLENCLKCGTKLKAE